MKIQCKLFRDGDQIEALSGDVAPTVIAIKVSEIELVFPNSVFTLDLGENKIFEVDLIKILGDDNILIFNTPPLMWAYLTQQEKSQ